MGCHAALKRKKSLFLIVSTTEGLDNKSQMYHHCDISLWNTHVPKDSVKVTLNIYTHA